MSTLRPTEELKDGDVVLTRKVFGEFVSRARKDDGIGTRWRTVESVSPVPRDRKTDPDRLIFFRDGTKAFTDSKGNWRLASGWSKP